jgi:transposase
MKDTNLYQQILGDTSPWSVDDVKLDASSLTVVVSLVLPQDSIWACPLCQKRMHVKEWRTRRWRHLDSCQFKTFLEAAVPVVDCPEHGAQTVQVPWSEDSSRFTLLFERFAIAVLAACSAAQAGRLLDISWDQADGIKARAVRRGLSRRQLEDLRHVCVDEKAVGNGHDYITVVTGVIGGKPVALHIGDGKGEEGLDSFWEWLGPEGCKRIEAVSMDMGRPYQASTRKYCPQAEIIFDPFHIMKLLNHAVDEVRREEALTGSRKKREALSGTRPLWLWGKENLPQKHADRFEKLQEASLKTSRAWRLKELWRSFGSCADAADGREFFQRWHKLAMASKLEPVKKVARTLKEHLAGIVTYLKHGFCNALAEGINSRIQLLVQRACGYRNRIRLKTDILFHLGGLDMNPLPTH